MLFPGINSIAATTLQQQNALIDFIIHISIMGSVSIRVNSLCIEDDDKINADLLTCDSFNKSFVLDSLKHFIFKATLV